MEFEKLKNLPDPDCPIGHVMMPELERLETLNKLQQSMIFITLSTNEFLLKHYLSQVKLISMKNLIAFH